MHEISIMQNTLDLALEKANASAARRIHCLRLRVGAMSGIVPEALQFAFEALRQGTLAAEARLDVETVPVCCWCAACQKEFRPKELFYDCPECGRPSTEVRAGLELELVSMEVS
jgi:hydrogenase nickel incorporation protein HypA/HybF